MKSSNNKFQAVESFLVYGSMIVCFLLLVAIFALTFASSFIEGGHPPFAVVPMSLNVLAIYVIFPVMMIGKIIACIYFKLSNHELMPQWKFAFATVLAAEALGIFNISFMIN